MKMWMLDNNWGQIPSDNIQLVQISASHKYVQKRKKKDNFTDHSFFSDSFLLKLNNKMVS